MTAHSYLWLASLLALSACGGGEREPTTPDESGDLGEQPVAGGGRPTSGGGGGTAVGREIAGTSWRWMEAHCTEGPLDLAARGFEQQLHVSADDDGLVLVYDHIFANERCIQTVVQRARPGAVRGEWEMTEEVRVAIPPTPQCEGRREPNRPGEVRRSGEFLEVLVQRSNWCNGLEVRMVYAPAEPAPLANDQVVRHYAAHFNRRDAEAIAALFASEGSLVDPFERTSTGGSTRLDGRDAVREWHARAFDAAPWVALRLNNVRRGSEDGQMIATWSYMDPNLEQPFDGESSFTLAAGEIFEAEIRSEGPGGQGGNNAVAEAGEAAPDAGAARATKRATQTRRQQGQQP